MPRQGKYEWINGVPVHVDDKNKPQPQAEASATDTVGGMFALVAFILEYVFQIHEYIF